MKKELKTQAFNAKVRPSVYFQAKKIAYIRRESMSGLLGKWLEQYVDEHQDDLDKYILMYGAD